ncbi:hypothetical protein LTR37_003923 [Vermiconidia calcicola]|uniref:Uncharacterized protein n=1 Tax=Vermiconidia calcicola TaxID=1690605 RepID=A0ACC3NNW1_9PEZI|nr:hypothetical protein LTR37_003923 [Vermiconidia calcicola]
MNDTNTLDPMVGLGTDLDDLSNLFEFGDIDLNNIPDEGNFGNQMQEQHSTHPNTPFQDLGKTMSLPGPAAHDFGAHEQYGLSHRMDQQRYLGHHGNNISASNPYTAESIYHSSAQPLYGSHPHPQQYPLHPHQGYLPSQAVPLTPTSFEMHGETGRFMHRPPQFDPQQRAILEQRYGLRKDDAIAYTPMVSPAGTPQFHMVSEYTTPGAYFSPLTSPMLHAQSQQRAHFQRKEQGYITNPSTAPSSNTNSPIGPNLDIDMLEDTMSQPHSAGPQARKPKRKIATARSSSAAAAKATQNVARTSQKRKSPAASLNILPVNGDDLSLRTVQSQPASTNLHTSVHHESSEAESISPEALSESLMGPPPRPSSNVNQSPGFAGRQKKDSGADATPAATPKSLLTIRNNQQPISDQPASSEFSAQTTLEPDGLDDLSLPEAASKPSSRRATVNRIDTDVSATASDDQTPRMSARKTPKLGPLSTPTSARHQSAIHSPAAGSPITASTPAAILQNKKDAGSGRAGRKRGSTSANSSKMVSPALVPKISPSIKPLLPEGTPLNTATQAMLLASKSNYQNMLEGNALPGVSYPDSLQSGLSSKRTSHKVAEQGRRNRINDALKEMQALIPKSSVVKPLNREGTTDGDASPDPGDEEKIAEGTPKESTEEAAVRSSNSKAATVELANEYIKKMQNDHATQSADLMQLKKENEELKRRLQAQNGKENAESPEKSSASSTSSSPAAV